MTATATFTFTKGRTVSSNPTPAPATPVSEAEHISAIQNLAATCQQVEFRTTWFSKTRKVSQGVMTAITATVEADARSLSVKKRLLSSKHPCIKSLNAARSALNKWRDSYMIVQAAEVSGNDDELRVNAGVRLILNNLISEFEAGFFRRRDELMAAARVVTRYLTESYYDGKKTWLPIIEMERQALGTSFNAGDYPAAIETEIEVSDPIYTPYAPSILLPETVLQREQQRIAGELDRTLEMVIGRLAKELDETFSSIGSLLVTPESINPAPNTPFAEYQGAEIVDKFVRQGMVTLTVQMTAPDGSQRRVKLDPVHESDYTVTFRPLALDKRRTLRTAALDHFFEQLEHFRRVKSMLGVHGTALDDVITRLHATLTSPGETTSAITREIKNSVTFRTNLSNQLQAARSSLVDRVSEVAAVRRRVSIQGLPPIDGHA